jgi:HAMP domain-containing protein
MLGRLKRRKLTLEKIADAAAQMPPSPSEAFLLGMELAGAKDPRGMILGVIDKAIAPIVAGIENARKRILEAQIKISGARADARQAITAIRATRDEEIGGLSADIAALRDQLAALQREQRRLGRVRDKFEAK